MKRIRRRKWVLECSQYCVFVETKKKKVGNSLYVENSEFGFIVFKYVLLYF